jgi:hypothetical protein
MAIGDYAIILDRAQAMSINNNSIRAYSFRFSRDFTRGRGCILTWRAHVSGGVNLSYTISLNGEIVWRTPQGLFDGDHLTVLHEIVDGNQFNKGNREQSLRFQVQGGEGRLFISDIVIHYGRDR